MEIIEPIYIPSHEVSNWHSIRDQAEELAKLVDATNVFAIHHMQVSEKPLNFFVLKPEVLGPVIDELGSRFIINPVVVKLFPQFYKMKEGCASFPHKAHKNVLRSPIVTVKYQIPDSKGELVEKTMEVQGLVAQIFQHEIDHGHGKNIYYEHPKPIHPRVSEPAEEK